MFMFIEFSLFTDHLNHLMLTQFTLPNRSSEFFRTVPNGTRSDEVMNTGFRPSTDRTGGTKEIVAHDGADGHQDQTD